MKTHRFEVENVESDDELFLQYPGQYQPQSVFVYVDWAEEKIYCRADHEIGGGMPSHVWNRIADRYEIGRLLPGNANELMQSVAEIADRYLDDFDIDQNRVGRFETVDRLSIDSEIERVTEQYKDDDVSIWDACDWFDGVRKLHIEQLRNGVSIDVIRDEIDSEKFDRSMADNRPLVLNRVDDYISGLMSEINS